jgi:erythromycin esterase-like protein
MTNVGQLVRERHAADGVMVVGFGSYQGTVIAGDKWGAPMQRIRVPNAQAGSWEDALHHAGATNKLLLMSDLRHNQTAQQRRGHRAIGVVYNPTQESGNYVPTVLPNRYDAFLYIDHSAALHPLHIAPKLNQPPETYPWGL